MKRNPELEPLTDEVLRRRADELVDQLVGLSTEQQIDLVAYECRAAPRVITDPRIKQWVTDNAKAVKARWLARGRA